MHGGHLMSGKKSKKSHVLTLLFILFILLTFLFPNRSLAAPGGDSGDNKVTIVYFYENVCGSCNPEGEFIDLFNQLVGKEKEGANIEFSMHNVFHDSGAKLLKEYYEDFHVPEDEQDQTMV